MGLLEGLFGGGRKRTPAEAPVKNKGGRPSAAESRRRRQERIRQMEERIEEAKLRAELRKLRGRGGAAAKRNPLLDAVEQYEETRAILDRRTGSETPEGASFLERFMYTPAGAALMQGIAPAVAPVVAQTLPRLLAAPGAPGAPGTPATAPDAPPATPPPATQVAPTAPAMPATPIPGEDAMTALLQQLVQVADLSPTDAGQRVTALAMQAAQHGNRDFLDKLNQARKAGAGLVRLATGKYRKDPAYGAAVARALDTPGWLEGVLAEVGRLLENGAATVPAPAPQPVGVNGHAAAPSSLV